MALGKSTLDDTTRQPAAVEEWPRTDGGNFRSRSGPEQAVAESHGTGPDVPMFEDAHAHRYIRAQLWIILMATLQLDLRSSTGLLPPTRTQVAVRGAARSNAVTRGQVVGTARPSNTHRTLP